MAQYGQRIIIFPMEMDTKIVNWKQDFLYTTAVKREEFVSDRVSYIVMIGRCCNIIVLNVHASSVEKSDDSKDSLYEELEQVLIIF